MTSGRLGALAALLLALGCATGDADLVLRGARIIDGTGAPPTEPMTVVVQGDRIARITAEPVKGARVIDLDGKFLLPGFVDLHVHLPPDSAIQEAILAQLVRYGVTTILNPGARDGAGVELRDRLGPRHPRMLTAGKIIEHVSATGDAGRWASLVGDEEAARREVRRQLARGVDFVKYYAAMPPPLVAAVVDEATRAGVPVIGHSVATLWRQAAVAGVSMLVHSGWGTPMDELVELAHADSATDAEWYASYAAAPRSSAFGRLTEALVERGVVVVPTLAITQAAGLGRDATLLPLFETELAPEADLPGWWDEGWRERHPQHGEVSAEEELLLERVYFPGVLGIVRAMFERGVSLGVGTDVGNSWITPGTSFHYEMALYERAGIPPLEILRMATAGGAQALGIADSVGSIAVGQRADLLALNADPTPSIAATRAIAMVILRGRIVPAAR
ncbi:MAG: amidohydrolase family protein [Gemmatimonadales bacterium]